MGVPTLDADPADADWTSELATGSLDTTMAFGKRELKPHPLAKQVKASNKLLRASAIGPEALVRDRLAYKFAVTEEKTFLTGSGNQQPLGLFTASADGVPTSRDVSTGNTATAITADGLIEAKYTLKAAYWPRARWIFSTTAVKNVRKLKDGNGQYLWAPGLAGGTPDTILDVPYSVSEYAPATFTTGLYVGLIGDLSKYWIVDALTLTVQRLVELYAATNQTGFIGRAEVDGAPVLAEAFVRVKLA
jgi:HK97 family phage major capsid protein